MTKKTVSAKEILADIKAGMDDSGLMQKYGLSDKGLQSIFKKLVDAGGLSQTKLAERLPWPEKSVEHVWKCPACGKPQSRRYDECPDCGVIVAKVREAPANAEPDGVQRSTILEEQNEQEGRSSSLKGFLVSGQLVNFICGVLLFIFGVHELVTEHGSVILYWFIRYPYWRTRQPIFTGKWAIFEGLVFIGAGVFFLYRAWKQRTQQR
ncbi:MAG: hypothetical protein ACLQPD_27980 [Desulfomonilaceae bacterium]